ncbi:hypothetical protein TNCV_5008421 [Trichonephila clavipes]|nr:hypothetical protein TNCV_5008421 [Trichonephila clavipes]
MDTFRGRAELTKGGLFSLKKEGTLNIHRSESFLERFVVGEEGYERPLDHSPVSFLKIGQNGAKTCCDLHVDLNACSKHAVNMLDFARTVTCGQNDRGILAFCRDEFRGSRSDFVDQVALVTTPLAIDKLSKLNIQVDFQNEF